MLSAALKIEETQAAYDDEGRVPAIVFESAELVRHKTGRRALIAYRVHDRTVEDRGRQEIWLGKLRRRGVDRRTLELSRALWSLGFHAGAADGIEIPEPLGAIEALGMWFQRRVPGVPLESLLESLDPKSDGRRLAKAFHKLHSCPAPAERRHTAEDEIGALLIRLRRWQVEDRPRAARIQRLIDTSVGTVSAFVPGAPTQLIHRDLHPGQVLLEPAGRLWFVDLDLATGGDPALDIGNFAAHLIELGLRGGDSERHSELVGALVDSGRQLRGEIPRGHVELYTQLSLARLADLSRAYPDRRHTTDALLELASEHLAYPRRRIA